MCSLHEISWLTSVQSPSLTRSPGYLLRFTHSAQRSPLNAMMNRRDWLQITFASLATTALRPVSRDALRATRIAVYKSPTCGCCANWVTYMKSNGFTVDAHDAGEDMLNQVKATAGVPEPLRSCHVALAGG